MVLDQASVVHLVLRLARFGSVLASGTLKSTDAFLPSPKFLPTVILWSVDFVDYFADWSWVGESFGPFVPWDSCPSSPLVA